MRIWKVLLNESFRPWASVLATVPISMVAMSLLGLDDGPGSGEAAVLFIIAGFLVLYAALSLGTFLAVPHAELKRWVAAQPPSTFLRRYVWLIQPGGGIVLYFAFAALVTALLALPNASQIAGTTSTGWISAVTVTMVFAGWLSVATTYAIDYLMTHHHLGADAIEFPGNDDPPFSDYLFLSVGMAAAYSPPGVTVRSSVLRRRMTLQMLIGFVFATVILASIVGLAMSELR